MWYLWENALLHLHIKLAHKIKTWDEYTNLLNKQCKHVQRGNEEEKKSAPLGGLHSLLNDLAVESKNLGTKAQLKNDKLSGTHKG